MAWVGAVTFTVTKLDDTNDGSCDADCSLREAVIAANNSAGLDEIFLPPGEIVFVIAGTDEDLAAEGDLDVLESVNIYGDASLGTVIDADRLDRVFQVIGPAVTVTMLNLTIQNGFEPNGTGAGVLVGAADLILQDVLVTGNEGNPGLPGGGLQANSSSSVTLDGSTIAGNSLGELSIVQSSLVAQNSTLSTASGSSAGSAIQVSGGGTADLSNVTLFRPPGFIYTLAAFSPSTVTVEDSIFSGVCLNQAGVVWTSTGGNLESPGQPPGTSTCGLDQPADQVVADVGLLPLRMNGGPTPTHGLNASSPAVGGAANCPPPAVDQRNEPRSDGDCDSGAFEMQPTDIFIFTDGFESGDTSAWSSTQ